MKTEYQSIDWAIPIIQQQLKAFPNSKISTVFKKLRNHPRFSLIGDYPLFSIAIKTMKEQKVNISKQMVRKALKFSDELKNKETLVNDLFNA